MNTWQLIAIIVAGLAILGTLVYMFILQKWPAKKKVEVLAERIQPAKPTKRRFVASVQVSTYDKQAWWLSFSDEDEEVVITEARELIYNLDKALSSGVIVYRHNDTVFRLRDVACVHFSKASSSHFWVEYV